jgi:hypothetical protein
MNNSDEQITIELNGQQGAVVPTQLLEQVTQVFKDLPEEDAKRFLLSLKEKGIEVSPYGRTFVSAFSFDANQISVTPLSDSISRLQFTALEVAIPGVTEVRVTTIEGPLGVPIPVPQTRQRYRRLDVTIDVDRNIFATEIPGFNLAMGPLVEAIVSFIVCLVASALVIAALTLILTTGPVGFGVLMEVFTTFAYICASIVTVYSWRRSCDLKIKRLYKFT